MFELIAGYKGLVISLILSTGDILKVETHNLDCAVWWDKYVITHERNILCLGKIIFFILIMVKLLLATIVAIKNLRSLLRSTRKIH